MLDKIRKDTLKLRHEMRESYTLNWIKIWFVYFIYLFILPLRNTELRQIQVEKIMMVRNDLNNNTQKRWEIRRITIYFGEKKSHNQYTIFQEISCRKYSNRITIRSDPTNRLTSIHIFPYISNKRSLTISQEISKLVESHHDNNRLPI